MGGHRSLYKLIINDVKVPRVPKRPLDVKCEMLESCSSHVQEWWCVKEKFKKRKPEDKLTSSPKLKPVPDRD